ncbi:hypothetical protein [Corynebacterium pilosum]|uniref:Putative secreted protein n=1 Tax=Corynebacterium pilosum TaxID=35756 RepID=A0A376CK63_9CORY|nr:hypothetical protein [Corynebacterium pilosum]STC68814.1 putative secreted protein [Corynebacterium pilosum]
MARNWIRVGLGVLLSASMAAGLGGCAISDRMNGQIYQVVSVYLEPESPDELPASAAGAARLVMGESTMTGSTGCAPLQAAVVFSAQGQPAARDVAETMRISNIEFRDPEDCDGGPRFVHDSLAQILTADTDYSIDQLSDTELILTKQTGEINQPSLRLMAQ